MRAAGAHLADGNNNEEELNGEDGLNGGAGGQLQIVIPVLLGILLVVILVGGVAVVIRKKGDIKKSFNFYIFLICSITLQNIFREKPWCKNDLQDKDYKIIL